MNYSKLPLFLVLIALAITSGCGSSNKKEEQSMPIEGSIPVKVGQSFQIKLPANPTGGYGWMYQTPLNTTHLKEVKRSFEDAPVGKATQEIPGYETWTFTALEQGTTEIALVYKQHWRPDGAPQKTYCAHIIIS